MVRYSFVLYILLPVINISIELNAQRYDGICGISNLGIADSLYKKGIHLADSSNYDDAATHFSAASRIYNPEKFPLRYVKARKRAGTPNLESVTDSTFVIQDELYKFALKSLDTLILEELHELCSCEYYKARNCRLRGWNDSSIYYSLIGLKRLVTYSDSISNVSKYLHYKNIGNTYQNIGDYEESILFNKKALDYISDNDFLNWAKIISNLGYLYVFEENVDYAITYLELGALLWENLGEKYRNTAAQIYNLTARLYDSVDDVPKAMYCFDKYINLTENSDTSTIIRKYYVDIYKFDIENKCNALKKRLFEVQKIYSSWSKSDSIDYCLLYYDFANRTCFQDNIDSVEFYYNKAISFIPYNQKFRHTDHIYFSFANHYLNIGQINSALYYANLAIESIDLNKTNNRSNELKTGYFTITDFLRYNLFVANIYYTLYKSNNLVDDLRHALNIINLCEESLVLYLKKYISFRDNKTTLFYIDELYNLKIKLLISNTSDVANLSDEIFQTISIKKYFSESLLVNYTQQSYQCYNHIQFDSLSDLYFIKYQNKDLKNIYQLNKKIINVIKHFIENDENKSKIFYDSLLQISSPILFMSKIQNVLKKSQAIVDYFLCGNALIISFINKDTIITDIIEINQDSLKHKIYKFEKEIINLQDDRIKIFSQELYHIFFHSFDQEVDGIEHLIIIPDGQIYTFPFDCLYIDKCNKYLIQNYNISYILSLKSMFQKRKEINYKYMFQGYAPYSSKYFGKNMNSYLESSFEEVYSICELFRNFGENKNLEFYDTSANHANFDKYLNQSRILHIASHTYEDKHSDMWGLYLWKKHQKETQKFYDLIPLTLNNISKNIYNNEIVVLNCCYTASGESFYNSGQNTIALNFYSKGAKNVIGTLWPVPDKYSKEFIVWFYTNFQKTQSFLEAFNLTQRMYVEHKKAPYFWGNFRFYGWN